MTEYFVDPVSGSDAAAGTSFGAAFKTAAYAETQATTAGDIVSLCATGDESISVRILMTATGTQAAPILWRGRDGTDGSTAAKYTIKATAVMGGIFEWAASTADGRIFEDIIFDGNANSVRGLYQNIDGIDSTTVRNCRVTDCTGTGIQFRSDQWDIVDTEVDNCGLYGIYQVVNRGYAHIVGCSVHDNTSHGFRLEGAYQQRPTIVHCLIYGNGGDGINCRDSYGDRTLIAFNTIHGNTGDGIQTGTDTLGLAILYNSITDNGGYGQNHGGTTEQAFTCIGNLHNGNTSGATNGSADQIDELTSAPNYVDEATADFTPDTGSPLIGAGPQGSTIGAVSHAAGGGGGGTSSVLGQLAMAGGMQ